MEVFIENLKELIDEKNLSLRKLAEESSVSVMQYSRYLGGSIPTLEVTMKMAKYFDCTLDYLFSLSKVKNNGKYKTYDYDMSKFVQRYEKLLTERKTTNYKFMKELGYDESILRHWKAGSTPRLDIIYDIAKNLDGSMDELVGRR